MESADTKPPESNFGTLIANAIMGSQWKEILRVFVEEADKVLAEERRQRDEAYLDRNLLLALYIVYACDAEAPGHFAVQRARMVECGGTDPNLAKGRAWVAVDPKEAADSAWRFVVLVNTGLGQLSWHIHEDDRKVLFGFLPEGENTWDGHTTEQKRERIRKLVE